MAEHPPRDRSRASTPGESPPPRTRRRKTSEPVGTPSPAKDAAPAAASPKAGRAPRRKRAIAPAVPETSAATTIAPTMPEPETSAATTAAPAAPSARRGREPGGETRSNALGTLIEQRFADPASPVRSYSDLERRSGVSREALSRYVTARADRRRSPTIETLAAIADSLRISLEQVSRAAVAGAHGQHLPDVVEQRARAEVLMPLAGALSDAQFDALVELLRQLQRREPGG